MRILNEQGAAVRGTVTDLMKKSGQKSTQGSLCSLSPHITCVRSSKLSPQKQLIDTMLFVGGWTPTSASCAVVRFKTFYKQCRTMTQTLKRCLIFTTGGHDDITCVSSVEKYEPSMDVWSSEVASLSSPRSGVCGGDGWVHLCPGGNIVERYDPVLNTWTKMASIALGQLQQRWMASYMSWKELMETLH